MCMVYPLWPSDGLCYHWSTLVEVMACCLMAPSHYLNSYWLIRPPVTHFNDILTKVSHIFIEESAIENVLCQNSSILIRPQSVKRHELDGLMIRGVILVCVLCCRTFSLDMFAAASRMILWMCPTNVRRRYNVTSSLIGWAHSQI